MNNFIHLIYFIILSISTWFHILTFYEALIVFVLCVGLDYMYNLLEDIKNLLEDRKNAKK